MIEVAATLSRAVPPFGLYAALSRHDASIHGSGIAIAQHRGELVVRADRAPFLPRSVLVHGHRAAIGRPVERAIAPSSRLAADLVVVRFTGGLDGPIGDRFRAELERQLAAIGGGGITVGRPGFVTVHGQKIRGFAVEVRCATEVGLELQRRGLGGKRSMGCGVFFPC